MRKLIVSLLGALSSIMATAVVTDGTNYQTIKTSKNIK